MSDPGIVVGHPAGESEHVETMACPLHHPDTTARKPPSQRRVEERIKMAMVQRHWRRRGAGLAHQAYLTTVGSYGPGERHIVRCRKVARVHDGDPIRPRQRTDAH